MSVLKQEELINRWEEWEGSIDCGFTNKIWSSGDLKLLVNDLAMKIGAKIKSGDTVALVAGNTVCFPVALMALLKVGANPLLLHTAVTSYELTELCRKISISWLINDNNTEITHLANQFNNIVIKIENAGLSLTSLEKLDGAFKAPLTGVILHPTSGTYSPKICRRDQYSAIAEAVNYTETITDYRRVRIRVTTPLSHAFAYGFGLIASIITHSQLVISPAFNPKSILKQETERLSNIMTIVPPMAEGLIHLRTVNPDYLLPGRIFYAGTRFNPDIMKRFEAIFSCRVFSIYGTTETGGISTTWQEQDKSEGVGKPLKNVNMRLDNQGNYKDINEKIGDVYVQSTSMMQGYLNGEELNPDIFFPTGDISQLTEKGEILLSGRRREIINNGGLKVDPGDVERVLMTHPDILDAAVYPGDDDRGEEIILAAVSLKEKGSVSTKELKQFLSTKLSSYKIPRTIYVIDSVPRTASGKCLKIKLPDFKNI